MDTDRFDRQMLLFGREGQEKISASRVAIVGLGGTGSHVAQQLAYLGVRNLALVDADKVTKSNLNRLIGASERDATDASLKVEVATRTIRGIEPCAEITAVPDSFVSEDGGAALTKSQIIFGCVDRDGARLLLTEFACAYNRPYFDLATDTQQDTAKESASAAGLWSGRPGTDALYCYLDLLDPGNVQRDLTSPERQAEEDAIYGVRRDALDQSRGPSVVVVERHPGIHRRDGISAAGDGNRPPAEAASAIRRAARDR